MPFYMFLSIYGGGKLRSEDNDNPKTSQDPDLPVFFGRSRFVIIIGSSPSMLWLIPCRALS